MLQYKLIIICLSFVFQIKGNIRGDVHGEENEHSKLLHPPPDENKWRQSTSNGHTSKQKLKVKSDKPSLSSIEEDDGSTEVKRIINQPDNKK